MVVHWGTCLILVGWKKFYLQKQILKLPWMPSGLFFHEIWLPIGQQTYYFWVFLSQILVFTDNQTTVQTQPCPRFICVWFDLIKVLNVQMLTWLMTENPDWYLIQKKFRRCSKFSNIFFLRVSHWFTSNIQNFTSEKSWEILVGDVVGDLKHFAFPKNIGKNAYAL